MNALKLLLFLGIVAQNCIRCFIMRNILRYLQVFDDKLKTGDANLMDSILIFKNVSY